MGDLVGDLSREGSRDASRGRGEISRGSRESRESRDKDRSRRGLGDGRRSMGDGDGSSKWGRAGASASAVAISSLVNQKVSFLKTAKKRTLFKNRDGCEMPGFE